MRTLIQRFQQLHDDEAGQGLVEYVMLIALSDSNCTTNGVSSLP
jgi:hypothetical protein